MEKGKRALITVFGSILLSIIGVLAVNSMKFNFEEFISLFSFLLLIFGTVLLWNYKVAIAGLALSSLLVFRVLNVWKMFNFVDPILILSLIGLMVTFEFMDRSGFLPWLSYKVTRFGLEDPRKVAVGVFLFSAIMSALVDEITTVVFLLSLVIVISREEGYDPRYLTMASAFGINIGSAATLIGSPIGIYLGTHAYPYGLSFLDFLKYSAPNVVVVLLITSLFLYFVLGKKLKETKAELPEERFFEYELEVVEAELEETEVEEFEVLHNVRNFYISVFLFSALVFGMFAQRVIEEALGAPKGTVIALLPILTASVALIASRAEEVKDILEKGVNWWLILYLIFALPIISSLVLTGIIHKLVSSLKETGPSLPYLTMCLSGGMSAWADNFPIAILFTQIYVEIVKETGNFSLWWPLVFGTCFGGNFSPVGSVSNLIAISNVERKWGDKISVKEWIKYGAPTTLISFAISTLWILLQGL